MAFLSFIKSNGKEYMYLSEYVCKQDRPYSSKRDKIIYRFGEINKALLIMNVWFNLPSMFPKELEMMGFGLDDVEAWIEKGEQRLGKKVFIPDAYLVLTGKISANA